MDNKEIKDIGVIQKESLRLMRHSKGYSWDIRLLEINIERMDKINNEMLKRYGN